MRYFFNFPYNYFFLLYILINIILLFFIFYFTLIIILNISIIDKYNLLVKNMIIFFNYTTFLIRKNWSNELSL